PVPPGDSTIRVQATDTGGLSVVDTFNLTVNDVVDPPTGGNLVVNGEFENNSVPANPGWGTFSSIPGWVATTGLIEVQEISGPSNNAAGDAVVELDAVGNSTVSQTINNLAAGTYEFSFAYAQGGPSFTNGIAVTLNGQAIGGLNPTPGYTTVTETVTHTGGDFVIAFAGTGPSDGRGTHIDSVSLIAVDDPDPTNSPPTSSPIADRAIDEDDAVSFSVAGSFSDPDGNNTLDFEAFGLPDGLSINGNTGVISGALSAQLQASITTPTTFDITVVADDDEFSVDEDFTLTVNPVSGPTGPSDNLIVNGEFEEHPTLTRGGWDVFDFIEGWNATVGGVEVQEVSGPSGNIAGDAVVELDAEGNSRIGQTVDELEAGRYLLEFAYALGGDDPSTNGMQVFIDDQLIETLQPTQPGYQTFSFEFDWTEPDLRLDFAAIGTSDGRGTHIDSVELIRLGSSADDIA
ncbi:MAG: putative Ig domain-containing protein, partial [Pseudomonadota bacterium]